MAKKTPPNKLASCMLTMQVTYKPALTTPQKICDAVSDVLDHVLLDNATMERVGDPVIGPLMVASNAPARWEHELGGIADALRHGLTVTIEPGSVKACRILRVIPQKGQ